MFLYLETVKFYDVFRPRFFSVDETGKVGKSEHPRIASLPILDESLLMIDRLTRELTEFSNSNLHLQSNNRITV